MMQCPFIAKKCDPSTNECVQCLGDMDCPSTWRCNDVLLCTTACSSRSDCGLAVFNGFGICDPNRSLCVECNDDADCATQSFPGGSDLSGGANGMNGVLKCHHGVCTQCSTDADCNGGRCERHRGRCF
jgi:hypothetical protein